MSKTTIFSRADIPLGGLGGRESAVVRGGNDRREGWSGTKLADSRLTGAGDVALGPPGEAAPIVQRKTPSVSSAGAPAIRSSWSGSLHDAELLDKITRRTSRRRRRWPPPAGRAGGRSACRPRSRPCPDIRAAICGDQLPLGLGALPLGRDLVLGPLGVAEVGEEDELVGTHKAGAVRAGETGQVADVARSETKSWSSSFSATSSARRPPRVIFRAFSRPAPRASR